MYLKTFLCPIAFMKPHRQSELWDSRLNYAKARYRIANYSYTFNVPWESRRFDTGICGNRKAKNQGGAKLPLEKITVG